MIFAHSPTPLPLGFGDFLRSTGLPQRPTGPALARTFRISDWPWADSGFHAALTSVGCPLLRPCCAQQAPSAHGERTGGGVPERRIGSEALEPSAKLRKSSVDCLSAASFGAARSEQLRLPAEEPLERRDASSCKSTINALPRLGSATYGATLFTVEAVPVLTIPCCLT